MTKRKAKDESSDEAKALFVEKAKMRVPRALAAIGAIGKLGGSNYAHTSAQLQKIKTDLERAVEVAMERLETGESADVAEYEI